jgi:hypothetical protein
MKGGNFKGCPFFVCSNNAFVVLMIGNILMNYSDQRGFKFWFSEMF